MFSCTLIYVHPSFANTSSGCHGFVCSLRLSVFKIILTILTAIILGLIQLLHFVHPAKDKMLENTEY